MASLPDQPKIYHIVHADRLQSILTDGCLFSDAIMAARPDLGTTVGMGHLKQRRMNKRLFSHPSLTVGMCVPFYFCPRSIMLYIISQQNHPDLAYEGGQSTIVHLEADLYQAVEWANQNGKQWAFTAQNASSSYAEDFSDLSDLHRINWQAVTTTDWRNNKEAKQAEFLMEKSFPWTLFTLIGVREQSVYGQVQEILQGQSYRPAIQIKPNWYY